MLLHRGALFVGAEAALRLAELVRLRSVCVDVDLVLAEKEGAIAAIRFHLGRGLSDVFLKLPLDFLKLGVELLFHGVLELFEHVLGLGLQNLLQLVHVAGDLLELHLLLWELY